MNDLEIVCIHGDDEDCEVWDYWGWCLFEGTRAECEEYIAFYEPDEEIDS